jgi:hypothetical protein
MSFGLRFLVPKLQSLKVSGENIRIEAHDATIVIDQGGD